MVNYLYRANSNLRRSPGVSPASAVPGHTAMGVQKMFEGKSMLGMGKVSDTCTLFQSNECAEYYNKLLKDSVF